MLCVAGVTGVCTLTFCDKLLPIDGNINVFEIIPGNIAESLANAATHVVVVADEPRTFTPPTQYCNAIS